LQTPSLPFETGPEPLPATAAFVKDHSAAVRRVPLRRDGVVGFMAVFLVANFLLRIALLAKSATEIDWHLSTLAGTFLVGAFFDLVAASYIVLPFVLYLLIAPSKWIGHRVHRRLLAVVSFIVIYALFFLGVAEWFFWDEFGARFNFIAVDYLIYTDEVIGNIRESYPLQLIFGALFVITLVTCVALKRIRFFRNWLSIATAPAPFEQRLLQLSPFLLAPIVFTAFVNGRQVPGFGNTYNQELARNGAYSFFSAFRQNELSFDQFYDKLPADQSFQRLRALLTAPDATFASTNLTDITRNIVHPGPEKRWNVIQITVESLSAEFLGVYGNTNRLTPHLDALAEQSLFFTNFYATGTRTVRGMEALTLSLPPTPGQSIVRRPHNENLFSLGSVFRDHGYDTAFIYGGYGYFDNMNYFFSENGYRVIDRTSVPSTNITFANIWGACDEDSLRWSMDEADKAFTQQRPFFHFVMTTSNHRPYTYPDGRIDIPSHSGREGGVKYTDYAIGQFIEKARSKPWFANTLFVIVADHCAASAGRTDLPIKRYEIPLLVYNPTLVPAQRVGTLCSQIDYPPTLLALLNWSYPSRFFGKDILAMTPQDERAFIASYQKLGLLDREHLSILKPVRQHDLYAYDRASGDLRSAAKEDDLVKDGIASYQTASYLFSHQLYSAIHAK
jgi:phosphoglycerol transferase MdoB-like AlkP superfamily enzyme